MRAITRLRTALSLAVAAALVVGGVSLGAQSSQAATLTLPDSGTIGGVDVSSAVDWSTVPSGTQFAYIEATVNGTTSRAARTSPTRSRQAPRRARRAAPCC